MKKINMCEVGNRIKKLRIVLKMTQSDLSKKIGVASNTVTQYEKGTSKVSIDVLANLAVALDTTTDYLLGLTD